MMGLVNNALRSLVIERKGEQSWAQVRKRAGLPADGTFVSMEPYPDACSYALVGAASEELGMPAGGLLRALGEHWIEFAAANGFEVLLAREQSFEEFLRGLNSLHARVSLSYPQLQPPSFRVTREESGALLLHYASHRPGLQELVIGLLYGLARRFNVQATVELVATCDQQAGQAVFRVQLS